MTEQEPPEEVIDELYSQLDSVANTGMEHDLGPLTIAALIHDYGEQLKVETLVEQRLVEHDD